ncbi:hypothetical protein CFC21_035414 [Triticum aestivum]|uniref:Endopeptidase Clp n=3 Tax=Triticum TaxID=4564 RepID=A0A9R0VJ97_TRITD|nr:hypothetical protein CFC21_035414 [Triticum aestivum]VAH61524.1 unnamed protein product [Triticum turgidum subsp. durum]
MPIGVPKVPYRIPGDEEATWVDLYNVMYRERTLFLGGWLISGMAIFDMMQMVTPDIYIHIYNMPRNSRLHGVLHSAWRRTTKRIAFPHARIMLHQPASAYYRARTPEFLLEVEELHKVREMITRVYAVRTGKPFLVVSEDMERDVFMLADEAKAYGLVDIVGDEMIDKHCDTDPVWFPKMFKDW